MNKIENKLSSREVADMMEVRHADLLKKIDSINEDFIKSKISFYKYWEEIKYKNPTNNKPCREFQITKRGCEFLAHKTTGTKGNLFTDRYMDKFEKMENYIIEEAKPKKLSALEQLQLQNQAILEVNEKVDKLENDMPLFKAECDELQALVKQVGTKSLGGYKTAAYNDKSLRGRVYSDIQHQLRREFGVDKYAWIKHSQFESAKDIISNYQLPKVLKEEIDRVNNQISIEEAI